MKLEIYKEKAKEEKRVELRIEACVDGGVIITANIDPQRRAHIVKLKENGSIYFYGLLREDLGFKLDSAGRVKVEPN